MTCVSIIRCICICKMCNCIRVYIYIYIYIYVYSYTHMHWGSFSSPCSARTKMMNEDIAPSLRAHLAQQEAGRE